MLTWKYRIALWAVLIGLFGALYALLNRGGAPHHGPAPMPPWFPLALIGIFLVLFSIFFTMARRGAIIGSRGIALAQQGRYAEAITLLERARGHMRRTPSIPLQLGAIRLALWQLDKAEAELKIAQRARVLADLRFAATPLLALVLALRGRVAEAEAELVDTEKRGIGASPTALVARTVLACRAGRWEEASQLSGRPELRNLGGSTRGLLDALRAWTREHLEGTRQPVDVVAVTGESGLEQVRAAWPELAEFLERSAAPRDQPGEAQSRSR